MGIDIELTDFLEASIRDLLMKGRDTAAIQYYYGFGEDPGPTYDGVASRYRLGSRQRVEQIVKSKFRDSIKSSDLPSAIQCEREISSRQIVRLDKISEILRSNGLIQGELNIGLMALLHDLDLCKNYDLYTPDLERITRATYFSSNNIFLVHESVLPILKAALKRAKKLPRSLGIARVSFVRRDLGTQFDHFDDLLDLLKSADDSWFLESNGDVYYLFESSGNALVNCLKKIKSVLNTVGLNELAETLANALNRRTPRYEFPSAEVIASYLRRSKHTTVAGESVELTLEAYPLADVEQDVVNLLSAVQSLDFKSFEQELLAKGYNKAWVQKSITSSPLVHVDKSLGRKNYRYSLIKASTSRLQFEPYLLCKQRLAEVSKTGTDRAQSGYSRVEQSILSDWLFKGKTVERCAICGLRFSVAALVTAHKKRRADCSANERIDPYIVMPLCLFGCDFLYENGYLIVRDGIVTKNRIKGLTEQEKARLKGLLGNRLAPRWLLGDKHYFRV